MVYTKLYVSICILLTSLICFSCNTNTYNKNNYQDFYLNDYNDTIARKIDQDIIVTKYEYTSKDKLLLEKIMQNMGVFYSATFYTQEVYEKLCATYDLKHEENSDNYKKDVNFWTNNKDYLLNFCYCVYNDYHLRDNDYHFVKEEYKLLFYIDSIRVRDFKTLQGNYYSNKDKYVFWTDKELNEEQIKQVINSNKPVFRTQEVEFILLDNKGQPQKKYISVLCYPNIDSYSFTFFHYNNYEYKYSFNPDNIKLEKVSIGMPFELCTKILGNSYGYINNKNGSKTIQYSNNTTLVFENGKLVRYFGNDDDIEKNKIWPY